MSEKIENRLNKVPVLGTIYRFLNKIKLPWLNGFSLYDLIELYTKGILEGAFSYHASAVAFSFFMALFPFALFILNLIPYIPIEGFQEDFLRFVQQGVPPNTFDAISKIINDILNNSHSGLLSSGFLLSIFLMANGVNGTLGGFQSSKHVFEKRGFFNQYVAALAISLTLSVLLIVTVATIVVFEVFIQKTMIQDILSDSIPLIIFGRYVFVVLMILLTCSILLRYGTKQYNKVPFISIGSVFTTILVVISSYFFGIWVIKFSKYNELYGSIGTLLILMFYIWINCMILLLGFELNATIRKLKEKNKNI